LVKFPSFLRIGWEKFFSFFFKTQGITKKSLGRVSLGEEGTNLGKKGLTLTRGEEGEVCGRVWRIKKGRGLIPRGRLVEFWGIGLNG